MSEEQTLKVWGEFACFTRPELKVERFSYPVITPSAARAIFEAIYCKPKEFHWQVTRVDILKPIRYIALRRNEVKDKAPSPETILHWAEGKEPTPLWADGNRDLLGTDMKGRTQRQTMALKDVCYYLYARISPWSGYYGSLSALEAQFRRRASQGKCFYQPYLGCREFPAFFELVEPDTALEPPIDTINQDIGLMLYDVFDISQPGKPLNTEHGELPNISLFRARIEKGVLRIPPYESGEVFKGRRPNHAGTAS